MKLLRSDIPLLVSKALDRPVRWSTTAVADYDGRERTLDVFEVDAPDQRVLLRSLRPLRAELQVAAGGPLVVVFHTRAESSRLYGEFLSTWRLARLAALVEAWIHESPGAEPMFEPDDIKPIDLSRAA